MSVWGHTRRTWMALATGVLTSILSGSVLAHPDHVAIAEVEHVVASNTLEVAVRCKPEDLERAIAASRGGPVVLESAAGEEAAAAYVVQNLRFLKRDGSALTPKWLGYEVSPAYAWLYFELALPGKRWQPLDVMFHLFMELEPAQQNTLLFRRDQQREALVFVFGDRKRRLPAPTR